jgi:hypothetical protein
VYEAAGQKAKAQEVLNRGLEKVPAYEEGGRARLLMSGRQIEMMSDEPLKVEESVPAEPVDSAEKDSAKEPAVVAAAN